MNGVIICVLVIIVVFFTFRMPIDDFAFQMFMDEDVPAFEEGRPISSELLTEERLRSDIKLYRKPDAKL